MAEPIVHFQSQVQQRGADGKPLGPWQDTCSGHKDWDKAITCHERTVHSFAMDGANPMMALLGKMMPGISFELRLVRRKVTIEEEVVEEAAPCVVSPAKPKPEVR